MEALLFAIWALGRCRNMDAGLSADKGHNNSTTWKRAVSSISVAADISARQTRHKLNRAPVIQVDESHWVAIMAHVKEDLSEEIPVLPVKGNGPACECRPDQRP